MSKITIFSFLVVFISFLSGCGQVKTINLKRHQFSTAPTQVVWLQVAGLKPEHFSMIRFGENTSEKVMAMEKATCVANLWNYNLYDLRPTAAESFYGQVYGSKNVSGQCRDYKRSPFWMGLAPQEYHVAILESTNNFSWSDRKEACLDDQEVANEIKSHYRRVGHFKMQKSPTQSPLTFHYQEKKELQTGQKYYDRSCQSGECFARLSDNARFLWENFSTDYQRKILIVQDDSYLNALREQDYSKAQEILYEIEKTYAYFARIQSNRSDFLLILSSAEAVGLEMPKSIDDWTRFFSGGKNLVSKTTTLDSMLFAQGARAENFCGVYQEAEVAHRLRWEYQSRGILNR